MVDIGPSTADPTLSDDTEYVFTEGNHTVTRNIDTTGHDNITFTFHPKADHDVFSELSGWASTGTSNVWKYEGFARTISKKGTSESGYRADYSIQICTSNDGETFTPFVQIDEDTDLSTTLGNLTTSQWYIDEDANSANDHDLYMYSTVDPDSLNSCVITSSTQQIIYGTGTNIIIRRKNDTGFSWNHMPIVRGYGSEAQEGVIWDQSSAGGWLVSGLDMQYNYGVHVKLEGDGGIIEKCRLNYGGQMGFAMGPDAVLGQTMIARFNEVAYNNTGYFSMGWEAGGCKIVRSQDVMVYMNNSHDNRGRGLWDDIDNTNIFYFLNILKDNYDAGINSELAFGAHYAHNWMYGNGENDTSGGWHRGGGFYIQNSQYCTAHNNVIVMPASLTRGDGMSFVQQDRGNSSLTAAPISGDEWLLRYNIVTHNTIYRAHASNNSECFLIDGEADHETGIFTSSNNTIDYNTYYLINSQTSDCYRWRTDDGNRLTDFQASGFDTNSTEHWDASTDDFDNWTDIKGTSWAWDATPDWWGDNPQDAEDYWNSLTYEQQLQAIPTLVRAWSMDDTSGSTIVDDGRWGRDATNVNTPTFSITGIGDGNTATQYVRANSEYADMYNSQDESLEIRADHRTITMWHKMDGSWATDNQRLIAWGADSASNEKYLIMVDATGKLFYEWAQNGTKDDYTTSALSYSGFHHIAMTYSILRDKVEYWKDGAPLDSDSAIDEAGWTAPNYSTGRARLNAKSSSSTPGDFGDHSYAYVYVYNSRLPDWVMENIVYEYVQAPTVTSISNQTDSQSSAITPFSVSATNRNNAAGTSLSYAAHNLPDGISINSSTGQFTGTPTTLATYSVEVITTAAVSGFDSASTSIFFDWTIESATASPVWDSITDKEYVSGDSVLFVASVTSTETITFTDESASENLDDLGLTITQLGPRNLSVSGTVSGDVGTVTITLGADDSINPRVDELFDITLIDKGTWTTPSNQNYTQWTPITPLVVTLVDSDSPSRTLSATGMPNGIEVVDNGDKTITFSGSPSQSGTFTVTLRAVDAVHGDTTDTFDMIVAAASSVGDEQVLTITAANVQQSAKAKGDFGIAGEAITAGLPIVKVAGRYYKALIGGASHYENCHGISVNDAAEGQEIVFITEDDDFVTGASDMQPGIKYVVGDSAGKIESANLLNSGDKQIYLYTALTQTVARIEIHKSDRLFP